MKKISVWFLVFAFITLFQLPAAARTDIDGNGTLDDPYIITNMEQYQLINSARAGHFRLETDLDFRGVTYTPLCHNIAFTGSLDGNGHTIKNVTIEMGSNNLGVFGISSNASFKDLNLENININAQAEDVTYDNVGALVGNMTNGAITGCTVNGVTINGKDNLGGLVGTKSGGSIIECGAKDIKITGNNVVGGIAGWLPNSVTVNDIAVDGVELMAGNYVGGAIGSQGGASSTLVEVSDVVIEGLDYVGGILGYGGGGWAISNSNVTGLSISAKDRVGGVVGNILNGNVTNCFAEGSLIDANHYVGGIVGHLNPNSTGTVGSTITDCYATLDISGNTYVGGLVGYINGTANISGNTNTIVPYSIIKSYAVGNVTGSSYVAGLIGYFHNSYYYSWTGSRPYMIYYTNNISNSFAIGTVTANDGIASGIVNTYQNNGYTRSLVTNSYAATVLLGTEQHGIGKNAVVTNSYFNSQITDAVDYTHGKLTSAMRRPDTYASWNFDSVWGIEEGLSYPYLIDLTVPDAVYTGNPTVQVTEVILVPEEATLAVREFLELEASVLPLNATTKTIKYASSDETIATVNGIGLVEALAPGTVTITATAHNGTAATCEIEIIGQRVPVTGVTVSPANIALTPGEATALTITVTPQNATNKNVTVISEDETVAEIEKIGSTYWIRAIDEGETTVVITTEDGGYTANSTVTVVDGIIPVTGVTVNPSSVTLDVGDTATLTATVTPSSANNQAVLWESSNSTIATVDANGLVTTVAPGTTTIIVTTIDGNFTDDCTVTVNEENPGDPVNLALEAVASSDSYLNNNRSPGKANDGDYDSSWLAKADDFVVYLELDFGKAVAFNELVIYEVGSRIGNYDIEVWDGSGWQTVYSGYRIGANGLTIDIGDQNASIVRIQIYDRHNNNVNAYGIAEFEVYNR